MTRCAVATWRFEFRIRMIRENVGRLHSRVPVLAVCNRVSRDAIDETHLSESTSRILDEIIFRIKFLNQFDNISVDRIAENSILRNRVKLSSLIVLSSVM